MTDHDAATNGAIVDLLDPSHPTVDPLEVIPAESRPTVDGRPWLLTNMVASLDGGTALDGVSGGLGGDADRAVFRALRASCDVILVASATANAERYRPPGGDDRIRSIRTAAGRRERPRLAIVSGSLSIDPTLPLFDDDPLPLVITGRSAPEARRRVLEEKAEVIVAGDERVDLPTALATLGERGVRTVLSEGGPSLNGQLVADGLVDEWNATLSPMLVAGTSKRSATGPTPECPIELALDRLLLGDGLLLGRWVRR